MISEVKITNLNQDININLLSDQFMISILFLCPETVNKNVILIKWDVYHVRFHI